MIPFDEHVRRAKQEQMEASVLHRTALIESKFWQSKSKKWAFLKPYIKDFRGRLVSEYAKCMFEELIGEDSKIPYYKNEAVKYREAVMRDAEQQSERRRK